MDLTLERFAELVAAVVAALPEPLAPYLEAIEFDVSDASPAEAGELELMRERLEVETSRRWGPGTFQRITIFMSAFADATSESELCERLRDAILDEVTAPAAEDEWEDEEGGGPEPRAGGADITGGVDIQG